MIPEAFTIHSPSERPPPDAIGVQLWVLCTSRQSLPDGKLESDHAFIAWRTGIRFDGVSWRARYPQPGIEFCVLAWMLAPMSMSKSESEKFTKVLPHEHTRNG